MKSAATDRQLMGARFRLRHRGSIINANVAAPETTLTNVKLAASISCCPNANRQIRGLAAKAIIATTVRDFGFATAMANRLDFKLVTIELQPGRD